MQCKHVTVYDEGGKFADRPTTAFGPLATRLSSALRKARWSKRHMLCKDGGNYDLGYTRIAALPDGSMLTAYYYNTHQDGGRTISASIFSI